LTPVILSWSGGKDSAMALHALRSGGDYGDYNVVALLTTLSGDGTVSHHGFGEALLDAQADAIGLPLDKIRLPSSGAISAGTYAQIMTEAMLRWRSKGVAHVAFGDLFLEDLRRAREGNLAKVDMEAVFPLWTRDTAALAERFFVSGFKAVIASAEAKLGEGVAGRAYDRALLVELPDGTDPCGEYGEFHSFVFDGPVFRAPVAFKLGETARNGDFFTAAISPSFAPTTSP
jgi:uncharacterized protein (TIGR00290 family)